MAEEIHLLKMSRDEFYDYYHAERDRLKNYRDANGELKPKEQVRADQLRIEWLADVTMQRRHNKDFTEAHGQAALDAWLQAIEKNLVAEDKAYEEWEADKTYNPWSTGTKYVQHAQSDGPRPSLVVSTYSQDATGKRITEGMSQSQLDVRRARPAHETPPAPAPAQSCRYSGDYSRSSAKRW